MTSAALKARPLERPAVFYTQPEEREPQYTYADYVSWDDDVRREVIGGRPYVMAAPNFTHQGISGILFARLFTAVEGKAACGLSDDPCRVISAPFDVRLFADPLAESDPRTDRDVVQPDVVVICDRKKIHREGCRGAPDLIIEILSESSRSKDMLLKFNKYLEAGVREYWVVDPEGQWLYAHRLKEGPDGRCYDTSAYGPDDVVSVGIFGGAVTIRLAEVFAAGALPTAPAAAAP